MKSNIDKEIQIFSPLKVNVTLQELSEKLKTSKDSPEIYKTAQNLLEKMEGKCKPVALFQWFDFKIDQKTGLGTIRQKSGAIVQLDLGQSIRFLKPATHVMISVHSIGEELDAEYARALSEGNMLEAYMIDLIGLTALEKAGDII